MESNNEDAQTAAARLSNDCRMVVETSVSVKLLFKRNDFAFFSTFGNRPTTFDVIDAAKRLLQAPCAEITIFSNSEPLPLDAVLTPPSSQAVLTLSAEITNLPEHLSVLESDDVALFSLAVHVKYGEGSGLSDKNFYVTAVRSYSNHPFIGGYRDKNTGTVFLNAETLCRPSELDTGHVIPHPCATVSRALQTEGITRSCQTRRECATQMPRSDVTVDETYDSVIVARPYFTAQKLFVLRVQKAILIQTQVRGWIARRRAARMREIRDEEELQAITAEQSRQEAHAEKAAEIARRRAHPRKCSDFDLLYMELEAWRSEQEKRIDAAGLSLEKAQQERVELLRKETRLLQTIERMKMQAAKQNKEERIGRKLDRIVAGKVLGGINTMTPGAERSSNLRDLYNGLQIKGLSLEERLDVLLHVKWTVKEFDCKLTREIVELVDREADLLNRGRNARSLVGLRQRLKNLFLQFIETPEFNPEAAHHQRVPLKYHDRPLVEPIAKKVY